MPSPLTMARAERASDESIAAEFARLTGKAVGRARAGAEGIWADANDLRQGERPVLRNAATFGLAGLLRAGDAVAVRAREVSARMEARSARAPSGHAGGSEDIDTAHPDAGSEIRR